MSNLNLNSVTSLDTGREVDVNRVMQTVDYVGGLVIDSLDTVIVDGDDRYVLAASTAIPHTTTGAGMPEGDAFVSVGDAVLRQDLANPDMGAAMVARGVVAVDSIADLLALPEGQLREDLRYLVKGYHAGSDVGGGEFYWDVSRVSDNDGGTVFNGFTRILDNVVTPEMFGAFGDGVSDDTEALVAAANKSAEYPLVMNGQYRKDGTTRIRLPSGANVVGTGTIKLLPHNATNYGIFTISEVGDITIRGITVDGNRNENSATGGEWGMGFDLRSTTGTVTLDSVTAINCWGDGVYIGENGEGPGCEHVKIINSHIKNCRRQGISVIAVDHLDIVDGIIEDIGGTSPQAGIDFEPNYERNKIRKVRVTGLEVRNTVGPSINIDLRGVGLTEEYETDIEFTNFRTNIFIQVQHLNEMMKGRIFIDFTATDLNTVAARISGVHWFSTLDLTLRPRIHNHNMSNQTTSWGYAFYMGNQNEDVDWRGPRIIDLIITEDEPRSVGILSSHNSIKDTQIVNPIAVPDAKSYVQPGSKYGYEAVKLVGDVSHLIWPREQQNRGLQQHDFTVGALEYTSPWSGNWMLPTGTSIRTNSIDIFTSGGGSLTITPPSGGHFAGSDVDAPVVIPAQPGSGVKITPLGDDVFGAVTGFYTRNE